MTTRLLSGVGLSTQPDNLIPHAGYVWRIRSVLLLLYTGATAGTRQVRIVKGNYPQGSPTGIPYGEVLADTSAQTGTGQTYAAGGGYAAQANFTYYQVYSAPIDVGSNGVISLQVTLVSGDTYTYYVEVDEVLSI